MMYWCDSCSSIKSETLSTFALCIGCHNQSMSKETETKSLPKQESANVCNRCTQECARCTIKLSEDYLNDYCHDCVIEMNKMKTTPISVNICCNGCGYIVDTLNPQSKLCMDCHVESVKQEVETRFLPKQESVKNDEGKVDPTMLTWEMVEAVSRVRMFGAGKYGRGNFKISGFKYTRSLAAALRHIFAFLRGEDNDKESGLSHLAHAICCLEHCIYDSIHHPENDDRKE